MGSYKHGEPVPWSAGYARRVFDGEWAEVRGESQWVTAAIDDSDDTVRGFVEVVPKNRYVGLTWFPEPPEVLEELKLAFYLVDEEYVDRPEGSPTHAGFGDGEVAANAGRLRLTHAQYLRRRDDESGIAENWIIGGNGAARRHTSEWDAGRNVTRKDLTDYEDVYGLLSEDLWFDYPEFDRYDHLIFRDSPALAKLGVPEEIRSKPIPAMPPEVVG